MLVVLDDLSHSDCSAVESHTVVAPWRTSSSMPQTFLNSLQHESARKVSFRLRSLLQPSSYLFFDRFFFWHFRHPDVKSRTTTSHFARPNELRWGTDGVEPARCSGSSRTTGSAERSRPMPPQQLTAFSSCWCGDVARDYLPLLSQSCVSVLPLALMVVPRDRAGNGTKVIPAVLLRKTNRTLESGVVSASAR